MLETYIEIDTKQIKNNIREIIKKYPYEHYIAVVKGNAYGYGFEVSKYIVEAGIKYLAVSTIEEANKVRKFIPKEIPILILHPVKIEDIKECEKQNYTITISSFRFYKELLNLNIKHLNIHLKINTGMNRLGLDNPKQIKEIFDCLTKRKNIIFEGIYTHMATLGIVDTFWDHQINEFNRLTKDINLNKIPIRHIYSSNSLAVHPKQKFCNGVRLGQLIYGNHFENINKEGFINKLKDIKRNYVRNKYKLSKLNKDFSLEVSPALNLCSTVIELKDVKQGSKVGYDASYKMQQDGIIATIPIGYCDGMSPKVKYVEINNKTYNIVGEVNMCMITVLVDNDVKLYDKVIIYGKDRKLKKVASETNTSVPYLTTTLNSSIKRLYK